MRKVIGIGETILDIIFRDNQPIGAVPGGSVFNSMVSLGRSGVDATFISETGNDRVGEYIIQFLRDNGVNADNVAVYSDSKSPISLAFLNDDNDAEYLFYKFDQHVSTDNNYPDVRADDIIMLSSFYALNPITRPQVEGLLALARSRGAIIYYDVNFRASHRSDIMKITPNLIENLEYADIVRGSTEDFGFIYGKSDPDKVYKSEISFYCKNFVCTNGGNPAVLLAKNGLRKEYPAEEIETISTIGAGDSFNAGVVYGLIRYGITHDMIERGLSESQWDGLIRCANAFSAECCKDIYNYVSPGFGEKMRL